VTRPDFRVYLPPVDRVEERVDVWFPSAFDVASGYRGYAYIGRLIPVQRWRKRKRR